MAVDSRCGLSSARRRLLDQMRQVEFGTLRGLRIRAGEPLAEPRPQVTREVKFGAGTGRPETGGDFLLKAQVVELFEHLDRLRDGTVVLEVRHGLPFRMLIEDEPG